MGRLDQYDPIDRKRIASLASRLVAGQIERGEIPCTEEAIKAALPGAIDDARLAVTAANEYLPG